MLLLSSLENNITILETIVQKADNLSIHPQVLYKLKTHLNALFVIDPADHFDTHLRDLAKILLLHTDIPEYLYHAFPHANASILQRTRRIVQEIMDSF